MAILHWGRRWNPFEDLARVRREMDKIFGAFEPQTGNRASLFGGRDFPLVNMYETPDDYLVTAEVPGIKVEDVEISVTGDTLTVKGKRSPEVDREKVNCHRQERDFGSFGRTIALPAPVATDKVEATYVNGVLQIKLPKAEETKPRVITVNP